MKKDILWLVISFLIVILTLAGCAASINKDQRAKSVKKIENAQDPAAGGEKNGYFKHVKFEKFKGKERVTISFSKTNRFDVSRFSNSSLLIKVENTIIPEGVKRRYEESLPSNIKNVSFSQRTIGKGVWAYITIELNNMVPYRINKEEGLGIIVDFDVSAILDGKDIFLREKINIDRKAKIIADIAKETEKTKQEEVNKYKGRKMSLDFQDADIKSVLRLISEVSGHSIVAGTDVRGDVTINMKNVPWDQALETVLYLNGLGMEKTGTVIRVLPQEVLKKAEEDQLKADAAKGKLRQVSIEAKIVEVDTTFTRKLGVSWAAGFQNSANGKDYGLLFGTGSSGTVTSLPNNIGLTDSNIAVNFPSVSTVTTPQLGIILGSSKMILDAQISALENTGKGKIISSPKVTTLDNVKATMKQGQEIPYAVIDKEGNRTIEFKDAALLLEVLPKITEDGKISMEIRATNDFADYTKTNVNNENPPINTSEVNSTIVVRDGDTIVVGGVYKITEQDTVEGIPFLSKIPILGWLFKTETKEHEKREILIFVTPRVIKDVVYNS